MRDKLIALLKEQLPFLAKFLPSIEDEYEDDQDSEDVELENDESEESNDENHEGDDEGEDEDEESEADAEDRKKKEKRSKYIKIFALVAIVYFVLDEIVFKEEVQNNAPTIEQQKAKMKAIREKRRKARDAAKKKKQIEKVAEVKTDQKVNSINSDTNIDAKTKKDNNRNVKINNPQKIDNSGEFKLPEDLGGVKKVKKVVDDQVDLPSPEKSDTESTTASNSMLDSLSELTGELENNLSDDGNKNEKDSIGEVDSNEVLNIEENAKTKSVVKDDKIAELPDYDIIGRGLVYNCKEKYWACVNRKNYFQCKSNQTYNERNKNSYECHIVDVYATIKDCKTVQLYNINMVVNPDFCKE